LSRCPKKYFIGTRRALGPEETSKVVEPKAKAVGVTRLSDVTGLDRVGIPVLLREAEGGRRDRVGLFRQGSYGRAG